MPVANPVEGAYSHPGMSVIAHTDVSVDPDVTDHAALQASSCPADKALGCDDGHVVC
jgi:hypothetical protein